MTQTDIAYIWNICVTNDHGYVPLVVNTSRSFPHSRFITGFVTRLTRRVPLVEQELPTLPEHLSSPPVFSAVRVTRSLVLYVCFVDRCLSFCPFSFGHCIVCSSSIYAFWLPLWYLQTRHIYMNKQRSTKHAYKAKDRVDILTITIMCKLRLPLFQDTKLEVIRLAKFLEVPHEEELID
jgi:hypothetical protein